MIKNIFNKWEHYEDEESSTWLCGSCAIGIELILGKVKGIKNVKVSMNERNAVVEYDRRQWSWSSLKLRRL